MHDILTSARTFLDTCQVHSSSVLAGEGVGFKKSIGTVRQMNEREHLAATAFLWAIYVYIYIHYISNIYNYEYALHHLLFVTIFLTGYHEAAWIDSHQL